VARGFRSDGGKFGLGPFHGDARRETADDEQSACAARVFFDDGREGNPGFVVFVGKGEPWRHHAHYGVRRAVHGDAAADDAAIALVTTLPDIVAPDDDGFGAWPIVLGTKETTDRRRHASRRGHVPGGGRGQQRFWA